MYYYIKKTMELAKTKKIPYYMTPQQKRNGVYIRVLLGQRKDKSFFMFENQLKPVGKDDLLSDFEISCLKSAFKTEQWKNVCQTIKLSRGGAYPKNWFEVLRKENMVGDSDSESSGNSLLNTIISSLIKNMSHDTDTGVSKKGVKEPSGNQTIIFLEADDDSGNNIFSKIKPDKKQTQAPKNNENRIYFFNKVKSTLNKTIDFVVRFKKENLVEDGTIQIQKDSVIEFCSPCKNIKVVVSDMISSKIKLYELIYENLCNQKENFVDETTIDDIGINYIEKISNSQYKLYFLF